MDSNNPKVTVLMPAYNAAKYIAEAINSVLEQSFTDFELLIVNDGSTDDTTKIIRSFKDRRIVLLEQANQGVGAALNVGLTHARAPFIARFDADDICYPNRLDIQYRFMMANPEYHILGSAADYMDMTGNFVFNFQPAAYCDQHIQQLDYTICPFIHSTVFYKKALIIAAGGYDKNALGFEDHLLWRKIISKGNAFNFSQSMIRVRLNPESVTIDEKWCAPRFREIKYSALKKGSITDFEGNLLRQITKTHHHHKLKQSAYYALLAKKFLWNNHQPVKARQHLKEVLGLNRFDWRSYGLFVLSFLPGGLLLKLYNTIK